MSALFSGGGYSPFSVEDIAVAPDHTCNPFQDHWYWMVRMPYGPGFGRCWTVAGERPSRNWVFARITELARRSSYEVACGRMLGPWGARLE